MERNHFLVSLKPWCIFPAPSGHDDNPNIDHYMGHGEIRLAYDMDGYIVSAMVRNNFWFPKNKGALELGYSFPLSRSVKGCLQYFVGYGESLIDYNYFNQRFGIGIALSDWL